LCQSLAKLKSQEFFDKIIFFKDNELEYNFLMGFNFRHQGNKKQALKYYDEVLRINPNHKRTKHELVSIYLNIGDYKNALNIALENYVANKSNMYNIHSLFVSIVRTGKGKGNVKILNELLENIKKSPSSKGKDMIRCMEGEYEYYINDNLSKAMKILEDAIVLNENKVYPSIAIKLINKNNTKEPLATLDKFEEISDIDYLSIND
jgi:tetratricopeptide (TPR) repeat protein